MISAIFYSNYVVPGAGYLRSKDFFLDNFIAIRRYSEGNRAILHLSYSRMAIQALYLRMCLPISENFSAKQGRAIRSSRRNWPAA